MWPFKRKPPDMQSDLVKFEIWGAFLRKPHVAYHRGDVVYDSEHYAYRVATQSFVSAKSIVHDPDAAWALAGPLHLFTALARGEERGTRLAFDFFSVQFGEDVHICYWELKYKDQRAIHLDSLFLWSNQVFDFDPGLWKAP